MTTLSEIWHGILNQFLFKVQYWWNLLFLKLFHWRRWIQLWEPRRKVFSTFWKIFRQIPEVMDRNIIFSKKKTSTITFHPTRRCQCRQIFGKNFRKSRINFVSNSRMDEIISFFPEKLFSWKCSSKHLECTLTTSRSFVSKLWNSFPLEDRKE